MRIDKSNATYINTEKHTHTELVLKKKESKNVEFLMKNKYRTYRSRDTRIK